MRDRESLAGASRGVTIVVVAEDDPIAATVNKHAVELAPPVRVVNELYLFAITYTRWANPPGHTVLVRDVFAEFQNLSLA